MKTSIKNSVVVLFLVTMLTACNQGETLQSYFVEHQETPNFMSVDVPLSFLDLDKVELTEEQLEAYESIDKLNMLGYKLSNENEEEYKVELQKVRTILKDSMYQELFRGGNNKDGKFLVKYIGSDTSIDELIVLGNMNESGFAVVRVLGDDMDPSKIMKLGDVIDQIDTEENQVKEFLNFFN